jgi:peptide/nickel transport system permease protein
MTQFTEKPRVMLEARRSRKAGAPRLASVQGITAVVLLTITIVMTLFAGILTSHDPLTQDLANRLSPPDWHWFSATGHPLGTDSLGRDIWARVVYGGRTSTVIALAAVVIGGVLGALIGLVAGYFGGATDRILMRFTDIQLALPPVVLGLAVVAVHGADLLSLVAVMSLSVWPPIARVFRAEALSLRSREYVEAARTMGAHNLYNLLHHVLPNAAGPGVVMATLELGRAVLLAASLSFLGLGIQPPTPDWGAMLSEGRDYLASAWWICTFPGIALAVFVTGVNLAGDWLRDKLDPHVEA